MKYLPFESITYRCKLDEEEIISRLTRFVRQEEIFRLKLSEGKSNRSFHVEKRIPSRYSLSPQVIGSIKKNTGGSTINVDISPNPAILAIYLVFGSGVGIGCIACLFKIVSGRFEVWTLLPFATLVIGYLVVMGIFKSESKAEITKLQRLFDAEVITRA